MKLQSFFLQNSRGGDGDGLLIRRRESEGPKIGSMVHRKPVSVRSRKQSTCVEMDSGPPHRVTSLLDLDSSSRRESLNAELDQFADPEAYYTRIARFGKPNFQKKKEKTNFFL